MNRLSRFVENIEWVIASPSIASVETKAEILVSRQAIRRMTNILRTYVLINYETQQHTNDKHGIARFYQSVVFRKDVSEETGLSKISAIAFFTEQFCKGGKCLSFFYYDQPWENNRSGFTGPLIQFMFNHSPK